MAYIFEEWTKMLEKFQQCVDKGVEEMHQQKSRRISSTVWTEVLIIVTMSVS